MTSITDLYNNIIALLGNYFYKTEEKPIKYNEWLTSEYINGRWYIGEEGPSIVTPIITDKTYEQISNAPIAYGVTIYGENIPVGADIDISSSTNIAGVGIQNNQITFVMVGGISSVTISIPTYFDNENNILYNQYTTTITF